MPSCWRAGGGVLQCARRRWGTIIPGWLTPSEQLNGQPGAQPMLEQGSIKSVPTTWLEHPAIRAWNELYPERMEPQKIETLKKKAKRSAVYRLEGLGPQGSAVIAK